MPLLQTKPIVLREDRGKRKRYEFKLHFSASKIIIIVYVTLTGYATMESTTENILAMNSAWKTVRTTAYTANSTSDHALSEDS